MFEVYKKGQGKYTRVSTFIAVMVIVVIGAYFLSRTLRSSPYLQFGIPTLMVVALAWFMFWILNRPKTADFLIATEGEMKKVSWSTRKEVIESTKVVIVTTFILAAILAGVDILFTLLFGWIGVTG